MEYLYVGTADFDRDSGYYEKVLGVGRVGAFNAFGARVAAFRVCDGPPVLLADHRPAPSCMPVFAVADLSAAVRELKARGWRSEGEPFEIPNGPCSRFADPMVERWHGIYMRTLKAHRDQRRGGPPVVVSGHTGAENELQFPGRPQRREPAASRSGPRATTYGASTFISKEIVGEFLPRRSLRPFPVLHYPPHVDCP